MPHADNGGSEFEIDWLQPAPIEEPKVETKVRKLDWIDFLKPLSLTKQNLIRGATDPKEAEKAYNAFMINRSMSQFPDVIMFANELNLRADIDSIMQHDFYLHALPKKSRFSKWAQKNKLENLELVKEYFNYGNQKAMQALKLLSADDIEKIKEYLNEGGRGKRKKDE